VIKSTKKNREPWEKKNPSIPFLKLLPISTRCQFLGIIPLAFSVGLKTVSKHRKLERVHEQMLGQLDVAPKTYGRKGRRVFGGKSPSPVDQGFAGVNREERSLGY
jgi:hypothetical protein